MTRLWKWLILIIFWAIVSITLWLIVTNSTSTPPTTQTSIADCTHAAKLHDQEMRRFLDTIKEQGEIIGAYEFRYKGLTKLEDIQ